VRNNDGLLKWQTTDEINTSSFNVEHSIDGQHFSAAGTVGAVNSAGVHEYQFVHSNIGEGYHYYRLKMIDIDGSFTYSDIKKIKVTAGITLEAFPNPARNFVTVKGLEANGILELVAIDGKCVYRTNTISNSVNINLSNITSGVYIIRYVNHDQVVQQIKILKQ